MKKRIKYVLLIIAIVLVGLIVSASLGYRYAHERPSFYRTYQWDPTQRSVVSQRALNKLLQTKELAAAAHFAEVRARTQTRPSASIQALVPKVEPLTISFTQEELNAFLFHNIDTFQGLRKKIEEHITDPGVFLEAGRLIVAGRIKGTEYLASFHFAPRMDEQGQFRLDFVKAMAGRLPIPRSLVASQIKKLQDAVASRLPDLQRAAMMDDAGGSNPPMVMAAGAKLLLSALAGQPAPPVLFMPVDERGKAMPLRLRDVRVAHETISLTVEPMTPQERAGIKDQIKR